MPAYTHDFELVVNGITVAGELAFGETPHSTYINTSGGEEMSVAQHGHVQELFLTLMRFCACCGTVESLELKRKAGP